MNNCAADLGYFDLGGLRFEQIPVQIIDSIYFYGIPGAFVRNSSAGLDFGGSMEAIVTGERHNYDFFEVRYGTSTHSCHAHLVAVLARSFQFNSIIYKVRSLLPSTSCGFKG